MRPITHIVVHHSLTKDGQTVSWGAIERYHRETMGWSDVGYMACAEQVGESFYALYGRPVTRFAAACREANMNQLGLHICLVGNFDLAPPPEGLLKVAVQRVIGPWMVEYGISERRIIGHRDAGLMEGLDWRLGRYKSCPGAQFDLDQLRRLTR